MKYDRGIVYNSSLWIKETNQTRKSKFQSINEGMVEIRRGERKKTTGKSSKSALVHLKSSELVELIVFGS